MRHFSLLLFVLALSLHAIGQTGQYISSERFSSGLINDICQDKFGFMWIATENGLNRYDGYRFTAYQHQPGDSTTLVSNIVVKLFCDSEGQLWVGTRMGLSRYDYATDRFVNYPFPKDEAPRVISIVERPNGELLIGTSGRGLYTIRGGNREVIGEKEEESSKSGEVSGEKKKVRGKNGENREWVEKIDDGYTTGSGNWYFNQMAIDSRGRFWKCGYGDEVTMHDGKSVRQFFVDKGIVVHIAEIADEEMLVICQHGICSIRDGKTVPSDIDLSVLGGSDVVMCSAFQDTDGNIYIGTRGDGLFLLKRGSRRLERVVCGVRGVDLNTAKVLAISQDRLGNIWLGCQSRGLIMLPRLQPQFSSWDFATQHYFISSTVTSVCEGSNGMTWCTVQGSGVFGFDAQGHIVAHPAAPSSAEVIYRDPQGNYWVGTDDALYAYDPTTGRYQHLVSLACDKVNGITSDGQGNLYISTYSRGFCIFNTATHDLQRFNATDKSTRGVLCNNWIMAMMPDRAGRIWFATSSGVSCYDPKTVSFRSLGWDSLMDGMICFSLCETIKGDILIGTDQGIYRYHPGDQKAVPFEEDGGLANRSVAYIVEANNHDIWCATSMGIWQYDTSKKKFIGHVNGNGLTAKEYVNSVGMHTAADVICFANNDGLTVFSPAQVTGSHTELPDITLTGFFIAGNPVNTLTESNDRQVTEEPVTESDYFRVSYLDNSVTLEFSLLDYNNPQNISYEYRINGEKWIPNPEGQNAIQLTHLQPGKYDIDVRALTAGIYSTEKTITVEVTPPWYKSTWAYTIYALGLLGLLGLIGLMWRRRATQQLDEEKMKFLINATHDIRSPLTLIMGALGKLKNSNIDELRTEDDILTFNTSVFKPSVNAIDRNAQRLMLLVNQILDERRIDKNQMQLHCRETNLVEFISGICKLYQFSAEQRNITFLFEHDKDHVLAWIDRVNFDKVISNLLSNAFKYTFDDGEVKVVLRELDKDVEIQVIDNGVGFKEENPERLFDRFYQSRNTADLGMQGTGIGLNLCRSITELHGGQIKAHNRDDGERGSAFTIILPKGRAHLKAEQVVSESPAREILSAGVPSRQQYRQFRILIADDDREIADYIIGELSTYYKFVHAPNGKEALKTLLSANTPHSTELDGEGKPQTPFDLVISDVMMPEMDGITLLKRIKDNPNVSQVPVIMLTSKSEVEHKLEGLKSGADAYIAKPFSMEELHIQIDNLIDNVRRLRGKFSGAVDQDNRVENIEVKGNDEALMERIMRSVNANLSNPEFNVDALATDVGISRAQLHRKMKDITGISSGKFLRNLRMEQAARLLREGKVNVAQVADLVGYTDQAHFSTAFKSHFGQAPSEYAENHKGGL